MATFIWLRNSGFDGEPQRRAKTFVNSVVDGDGTRSFGIIIVSDTYLKGPIGVVDGLGLSKGGGKWWVLAETGVGDFKRQTCGSQRVDGDQLEAAFKHMFGVLTEKIRKIFNVSA
jgi:hypothetical protein